MKRVLAIIIVGLLFALGIYIWMSKKAQAPTQSGPQATPTQSGIKTFSHTFTSGFEGYNTTVAYSLSYPSDAFSVQAAANNPSKVVIKEIANGHEHTISFFNNEAAGFSSPQELFKELKLCPLCTIVPEAKAVFHIRDAQSMRLFESATDMWVVFAYGRGFVYTDLKKPIDKVKPVLESISISATRSTPDERNVQ